MGKQQKSSIYIDTSKCKPCAGLICVGVCPQGTIEEGKDGKPQIIDLAQCSRCGVCVNLCPAKAIIISKL